MGLNRESGHFKSPITSAYLIRVPLETNSSQFSKQTPSQSNTAQNLTCYLIVHPLLILSSFYPIIQSPEHAPEISLSPNWSPDVLVFGSVKKGGGFIR